MPEKKVFENRLPQCVIDYIEEIILSGGFSESVCREIREELHSHFEDALAMVEGEDERAKLGLELIAQFGNTDVLAVLIRRGKRRCNKETVMNFSGVFGFALFGLLILGAIALAISFRLALSEE